MLTHVLILGVILPPVLFEAAINIHWRPLSRDMLPVLTLSTLGVIVSAALVVPNAFFSPTRVQCRLTEARPAPERTMRTSPGRPQDCTGLRPRLLKDAPENRARTFREARFGNF